MKLDCKALLTLLAVAAGSLGALAQGTAFTYQGRLNDGAAPANGSYDMRFTLYTQPAGGSTIGPQLTLAPIVVANGLFTTNLDFMIVSGVYLWLQIDVRTNGSVAPYVALSPRQQLTPSPFAIYAEKSGAIVNNSVSAPQLNTATMPASGQVLGYNGTDLTWLNPATSASTWSLTGNAGTTPGANFLGTTDTNALEMHVNGGRAWRIEPTGTFPNIFPNIIGGFAGNVVDNGAQAATIGGGGAAGFVNQVSATLGTIAGGSGNVIQSGANDSTITGGRQNQVSSGARHSTIGGGFGNVIQTNASDATIAGGNSNIANNGGTIPGGLHNAATGVGSFAAGRNALATNDGCFVWSDGSGTLASSGLNRFEVLASGGAYFHNTLDVAGTMTVDSGDLDVPGGTVRANGGTSSGLYFAKGVTGAAAGAASIGVSGNSPDGTGVSGTSSTGNGIYGSSPFGYAGYFDGNIVINQPAGVRLNHTPLEVNGEFLLVDGSGNEQAYLGGDGIGNDVQIGSLNSSVTSMAAWNATTSAYMNFRCSSITIEGGSDLAEPFEISATDNEVAPGAVVIIDEDKPGRVKLSDRPYDTRVVGVVSGANGIHPGIQMQQQGLLDGGRNVALTGRVYVLADATASAIKPGDLLTTSTTPGHAMKVADYGKAQGAVLGKAMSELKEGRGMVLVLVTLQ